MKKPSKCLAWLLALAVAWTPLRAISEDIDIFTGGTIAASNPNVLIVFDNTSNWARQSQQWPGGIQQGQAEVNAVKSLIEDGTVVNDGVNMGIFEFVTGGNAGDDGGYVRYALRPMTDDNKTAIKGKLTTIYNDINGTSEKRSANTPYGNLMYDVRNYLVGDDSYSPGGVVASPYADNAGYVTPYTKFKSPITADTGCGRTFMIFISNPNSNGPSDDSADNKAALLALGGDVTNIGLPNLATTTGASITTDLGYTATCGTATAASCKTQAEATYATCTDGTYSSCACDLTQSTNKTLCPSGTQRYMVTKSTPAASGALGITSACTASAPTTFPDFSQCALAGHLCSAGGQSANSGACPAGQSRYMIQDVEVTSNATYATNAQCSKNQPNQAPVCNSTSTTTWSSCTYVSNGTVCGAGDKVYWDIKGTKTVETDKGFSTTCAASSSAVTTEGYTCSGTCTVDATRVSTTSLACPTAANHWAYNVNDSSGLPTVTNLDYTTSCYASPGAASTTDYAAQCSGAGVTCAIDGSNSTTTSTSLCSAGTARYKVFGTTEGSTSATPTGTYSSASNMWMADEWARYLHETDLSSVAAGTQNLTTFTIDVFNKQQNADHTALMMSMANKGGGGYFAAKSESEILNALKRIISEIQSVNTAFAAASIPLSTTNRSQNLNEVYIGVFRPTLEPRWFGNLKKFKIGTSSIGVDLVDQNNSPANNSQTGFLSDCAASFWTTDSGAWWENVKIGASTFGANTALNPVPKSGCSPMPAGNTSPWSDMPDGSGVEKGAVAEVIRKGNNPPTTNTTPTWNLNRTIYTRSAAGALEAISTTNSGFSDTLLKYTKGIDINVDNAHWSEQVWTNTALFSSPPTDPVRPSVHGDVVHSRPLAVDFGSPKGVIVFYGANDGMLRAVDGATGKEKWAFIPKEFLDTTKMIRLMNNTQLIAFGATPAPDSAPKDYMFDGSSGLYQSLNNAKVWLFPTQRRGGRMIHALDVTNPDLPTLKWYKGCPNLGNDTGCSDGFSGIGQTWSTPIVAKIKGYSTTTPIVAFGGGYDSCEDVKPTATPPTWACSDKKGRAVYILNADTGELLKTFTTERGVTGDVSFVDIDNDSYVDYAYVADLGGNIYRLSFLEDPDTTRTPLAKEDWDIKKVAYASGGRKLMFAPAVAYAGSASVYVALGSGDRERPLIDDYPYVAPVTNRFYTYLDKLTDKDDTVTACHLDGNPSDADSCVLDFTAPTTCSTEKVLPGGDKKAWRVDYIYQGEQTVTHALIVGGMLTVNTTRPMAVGTCSVALGEGGGYWMNLLNASGAIGVTESCGGERRGSFLGIGMPTPPVLINISGEDPILIGSVSRSSTDPSKLFAPGEVRPPISARKYRKYQFQQVD